MLVEWPTSQCCKKWGQDVSEMIRNHHKLYVTLLVKQHGNCPRRSISRWAVGCVYRLVLISDQNHNKTCSLSVFFRLLPTFWLAEINDVLKRSIVESSGLRNVLHMTTDLCKMKALLQKNQQRTNTTSTRFSTQFKQLQTFHSMWLSLGGHTATSQLFMGLWGLPPQAFNDIPSSLLTHFLHVQHLDVYPPGN